MNRMILGSGSSCYFDRGFQAVLHAADQRSYVWTYEYLTLSKDHAELEYYQTASPKTGKKTTAAIGSSSWNWNMG